MLRILEANQLLMAVFKTFQSVCVLCFVSIIDTQKQESTVGGGTTRHCFYGLQPDSEYKISIYTKLQELEGPGVSVMEKTRKSRVSLPDQPLHKQTVSSASCFNLNILFHAEEYDLFLHRKICNTHFSSLIHPPEFIACGSLMSSRLTVSTTLCVCFTRGCVSI